MQALFFILAKTVSLFLGAIMIAMIARMLMPIFVDVEENSLYTLAVAVSEPFVAPFRALLAIFGIGENSPIDLGFFLAYFILYFLRTAFPAI